MLEKPWNDWSYTPFPSSLVPLFQNKSKCETTHAVSFHANQSHFHKNGFALRLALKHRHKGTRKWPILQTDQQNAFPQNQVKVNSRSQNLSLVVFVTVFIFIYKSSLFVKKTLNLNRGLHIHCKSNFKWRYSRFHARERVTDEKRDKLMYKAVPA